MSIFNKQRSSEDTPPAPKQAAQPSNPIETKKEATPLSSMPFKTTPEPDSARGSASIGKAVKINGQIFSKEDLYIDGDVEGSIELQEHRLTIGPNGKVHSTVKAREVVVLGTIQGNVDASDRLEIRKDAADQTRGHDKAHAQRDHDHNADGRLDVHDLPPLS